MYQISNTYLKARTKKERKTNNLWYFSKSKGHNLLKNQWIKTQLNLDLYLGMAKQCTKYQINIWKHERNKCGKHNLRIFFSKSNLVCILVWQSNVPNIKWISESKNKTSVEDWCTGQTNRRSANMSPSTSSVGD
jgi:hypothetical protein